MKIYKFSTPTCGQCMMVAQRLRQTNVKFEEVDCTTDEGSVMAERYSVFHVPTIIILNDDGTERERLSNMPAILKAISRGAFKTHL